MSAWIQNGVSAVWRWLAYHVTELAHVRPKQLVPGTERPRSVATHAIDRPGCESVGVTTPFLTRRLRIYQS